MSFLDQTNRVDLGSGEWVDIKPLSVGELREMRAGAQEVVPLAGEELTEAQGYELTKAALEKCIVAWSDPAEPTPQNIARLPYKLTMKIANAIGLGGEEDLPLADGSSSTEV
jgi:hypothetical protein